MKRLLTLALVSLAATATEPRPKPSDYPVHADAGAATVAAEYMVHSFSGNGATFVAEGYLTVEVALYAKPGTSLDVNAGHFRLRLNGRKELIFPQSPGLVMNAMKQPAPPGRVQARAGVGDIGVILGRPRTVERFPGDPTPERTRLPNPPRAPEPADRSGAEPREAVKPEELVVEVALPEGPARTAAAGYLYFPCREKTDRIRRIELLYHDVVLRLR